VVSLTLILAVTLWLRQLFRQGVFFRDAMRLKLNKPESSYESAKLRKNPSNYLSTFLLINAIELEYNGKMFLQSLYDRVP
jgi:hypothetical protein